MSRQRLTARGARSAPRGARSTTRPHTTPPAARARPSSPTPRRRPVKKSWRVSSIGPSYRVKPHWIRVYCLHAADRNPMTRLAASSGDPTAVASPPLSHLRRLEGESIRIFREVAAECERPVLLYSIGKDSSVMLHLALKAFSPALPPFPLMHIDTTWKFRAMYQFRDATAKKLGLELIVFVNHDGLAQWINPFIHGSKIHTDVMKTEALKLALDTYGFDAAIGGARRDEEKSRAKE